MSWVGESLPDFAFSPKGRSWASDRRTLGISRVTRGTVHWKRSYFNAKTPQNAPCQQFGEKLFPSHQFATPKALTVAFEKDMGLPFAGGGIPVPMAPEMCGMLH